MRFFSFSCFLVYPTRVVSILYQDAADVWLTVPAAWDARGCDIMREAAITAGLVQASRAGERNWRDRLHIITFVSFQAYFLHLLNLARGCREPEAAAVHSAHLTGLHQLKPSQNFMICDAGGGTVVRSCSQASFKRDIS